MMTYTQTQLIKRAREGLRESKSLDFKSGFDVTSREEWAEVVKDIVAFANSGGGVMVFGVNDDGTPTGTDVSTYLDVDPADLTNRVHACTGFEFSNFEILESERDGHPVALYIIYGVDVPMVFKRDGAHLGEGRARRPAYVKGSVYFRHGAKSAPGDSNDLRDWLDRSLNQIRNTWLGGIRQVVETGAGQDVQVVAIDPSAVTSVTARISGDPNAVAVRPENPEQIWPYRQEQLIERVSPTLPEGTQFNGHDVRCIKLAHNITPRTHPRFVFKPHEIASPQYSEEFARWITDQCQADRGFLSNARQSFRDNGNRFAR